MFCLVIRQSLLAKSFNVVIGQRVIIVWTSQHERDCYGTPTGVITAYDSVRQLYLVEHIEPDGIRTTGYYSADEMSSSPLLRAVSKAQQNKIETIIRVTNSSSIRRINHYLSVCVASVYNFVYRLAHFLRN